MTTIQHVPVGGRSDLILDRDRDARVYVNADGTVDIHYANPTMAQDEAPKFPRAALGGARGGTGASALSPGDQDPDDGTVVANSPNEAVYKRLFSFLADRGLDADDLQTIGQMVTELLGATSDAGTPAIAGDRRPSSSYSQHFPHANRLYKGTYK